MSQEKGLRVSSINVGRFLDPRTRPFLERLGGDVPLPDVLCIQDIPAKDLSSLLEKFPHIAFAPMTNHFVNGERMIVGIAMLSRYLMQHIQHTTYWGDGIVKNLAGINDKNERHLGEESDRLVEATEDRILITAAVVKDGVEYNLATTHGMWTRGGVTNDVQRTCMRKLRNQLEIEAGNQDGLVFVGDFNAGRGTEMYQYLIEGFRDEVPESVETTLDPDHKAVKKFGIKVVTDFVMQAPNWDDSYRYEVDDFRMTSGASDHQVISARIRKNV